MSHRLQHLYPPYHFLLALITTLRIHGPTIFHTTWIMYDETSITESCGCIMIRTEERKKWLFHDNCVDHRSILHIPCRIRALALEKSWNPPPHPPKFWWIKVINMMTSSNGNIFRVTGPLCGEFTGPRWIPTQRPVTRSFDVCLDLRKNKRLGKQSWGWWFGTLSWSSWRHRNEPTSML